jgi:hypothetical protein
MPELAIKPNLTDGKNKNKKIEARFYQTYV